MKQSRYRLASLSAAPLLAVALLAGCAAAPETHFTDAQAAFEQHQFQAARIHLLNVLNDDRGNAAANLLYARTMLQLGDGIAARTALDRLSDQSVNDPDYAALKAHADILRGQPRKAIALLDSIPSAQRSAQIFHMLIWAHLENETLDDNPDLFPEALERYDESADIHALVGRHAIALGDWGIARKAANAALERDGENYEALLLKAQMQIHDQNLAAAKATYRAIAALYPDHGVPPANIAGLEIDLGNYDSAAAIISKAQEQHPKFAFLQFQKARLAYAQKDYRRANDILQSMPDYLSDYPPGLVLSAQVSQELGNRQIAISRLQRLLAIVPDDDAARAMLDTLQQ